VPLTLNMVHHDNLMVFVPNDVDVNWSWGYVSSGSLLMQQGSFEGWVDTYPTPFRGCFFKCLEQIWPCSPNIALLSWMFGFEEPSHGCMPLLHIQMLKNWARKPRHWLVWWCAQTDRGHTQVGLDPVWWMLPCLEPRWWWRSLGWLVRDNTSCLDAKCFP